jgi:hypothetical protein
MALSLTNQKKDMNPNKSKRQAYVLIGVGLLLLVPLVAMQFTNEVNWTLFDFVVMGVLLTLAGLTGEWVLRAVQSPAQRILLFLIVVGAFLFIWAQLAVGVVDFLPGGS